MLGHPYSLVDKSEGGCRYERQICQFGSFLREFLFAYVVRVDTHLNSAFIRLNYMLFCSSEARSAFEARVSFIFRHLFCAGILFDVPC